MRVDEAVPSVYVVPGLEASEAQKWRKLPEWSHLATRSFYNSNKCLLVL